MAGDAVTGDIRRRAGQQSLDGGDAAQPAKIDVIRGLEVGDRICAAALLRIADGAVQIGVVAAAAGHRVSAAAADEPDISGHAGGIDGVIAAQSVNDCRRTRGDAEIVGPGFQIDCIAARIADDDVERQRSAGFGVVRVRDGQGQRVNLAVGAAANVATPSVQAVRSRARRVAEG